MWWGAVEGAVVVVAVVVVVVVVVAVEGMMILRPAASELATKPSLGERGSRGSVLSTLLGSAMLEREGSLMTPTTTTTVC